jgi:hypothetical protein
MALLREGQPRSLGLARRPLLVGAALAGVVLALFGTYWDDAWHTEEGRDTFFIAPHLLLYAGISLTGAAFALWALLAGLAVGIRRALRNPPLLLAFAGLAVTGAAAPIDNGWHEAFGRDAVIWSPPHMLGVAGSLLIAAALLLELGPAARGGFAGAIAVVAGAAVLAVGAIPVLEYETDVPQFDVAFYLPVLATGSALAFGLARAALPLRWAATWTALAYTAILGAIALVLALGDRPAPLLPLVIIPAAAVDLSRRLPLLARASLLVAALFLAYVPYLNWIRSDLFLEPADVAAGLPLAWVGSAAALALASRQLPSRPRRTGGARTSAAAAAALALALPASAAAHDPGQGAELTTASVRASVEAGRATLAAVPAGHCGDLAPARLVARRAGETLTAPLVEEGRCRFGGSIGLSERGRWFVYAELDHRGDAVETWLPVDREAGEVVSDDARSLYRPPAVKDPAIKTVLGILIYAVLIAALVAIAILYRRRLPPTTAQVDARA